jgi:hypothetical protein
MNENFNTPILFIVFNRPDTTRRVFEAIKGKKPKQLFVAADGPRENRSGEKEKCEEVRKLILDNIDWDCEVKTLFREKNLGCGKAVSSAISWYFQNVKQGIVLEDDCLPNPSFFEYCEELLDRYKENKKVMHIAGAQFIPDFENGASYYFARLMHCWGWAGWADRWQHYDFDLKSFTEDKIKNFSDNENVQKYWLEILRRLKRGEIDTWDYQWTFKIVEMNGLCINPSKNLISNIGYGSDSTHTSDVNNPDANLPTYEIEKIIHLKKVKIDQKAVDYIYRHHCGINFESSQKNLFKKFYSYLKK